MHNNKKISEDITDKLSPYAGPQGDWVHSIKIRPGDLGFETIDVSYSDGTTKKFDKDDLIV